MRTTTILFGGVVLGLIGSYLVNAEPPATVKAKPAAAAAVSEDADRGSCDIPAELTEPHFLSPEMQAVERKLRQKISLEFDNTPFGDVLKILEAKTEIHFDVDFERITDDGLDVTTATRLTLKVKEGSLRRALGKLFHPLQLDFFPYEGAILITTAVAGSEKLVTKVYPVADLVTYRADDQIGVVHQELSDLIKSTIEPDSWDDVGGPGSVQYEPITMTILIRQTMMVHEEVETLLQTVRQFRCRLPKLLQAAGAPTVDELRKAAASLAHAQAALLRLEDEVRRLEKIDPEKLDRWLGEVGGMGGGYMAVQGFGDVCDGMVGDAPARYPENHPVTRARRVALQALRLAHRFEAAIAENERKKAEQMRKPVTDAATKKETDQ